MVIEQKFKKQFLSPQLVVFLLIIFLLVLVDFSRSTTKYFSARDEIKKRKFEIEALEKRIVELKNLKEFLETEFYKEKEARERFGFMKIGERVIVLPSPKEQAVEVERAKEIKNDLLKPNFKNWWEYFFK